MSEDAEDTPEKPKLKDASINPWYVLMTVAGEQDGARIDWDLHTRNRRYFNGWMAQQLSEEQKNKLVEEERATPEDLAPLKAEEASVIGRAIANRCGSHASISPSNPTIELSFSDFSKRVVCVGFFVAAGSWMGGSRFQAGGDFREVTFNRWAEFERVETIGGLDFRNVRVRNVMSLAYSKIRGNFSCKGSELFMGVGLENTFISGNADFSESVFKGSCEFQGAEFCGAIDFSDARFERKVSFGSDQWRMSDRNATKFRCEPPRLFQAEIHEDTDFTDAHWPPIPTERYEALAHRRIYERLKLLMEEKSKFHDEFFFFQREMQCWQAAQDPGLTKWSIGMFGRLSEFGWSLRRPLAGMGFTVLVGWMTIFLSQALYYGPYQPCGGVGSPGFLQPFEAMKLSVSNLFSFLGFNFIFNRDLVACLTPFAKTVSMLQTGLGVLFLFLLVLALRNRFRIK